MCKKNLFNDNELLPMKTQNQGWWSRRLRTVQFFPKSKQTNFLVVEGSHKIIILIIIFNKINVFINFTKIKITIIMSKL